MVGISDPRRCVISRWMMNAYSVYAAYSSTLSSGSSLLSETFHSPVEGMRALTMRLISSRVPDVDAEHHDGKNTYKSDNERTWMLGNFCVGIRAFTGGRHRGWSWGEDIELASFE